MQKNKGRVSLANTDRIKLNWNGIDSAKISVTINFMEYLFTTLYISLESKS